MRTSQRPAAARASSQLASAATSEPACNGPVGDGANRPTQPATDERVLDAVAQAPVAAHAQRFGGVPDMAATQWLQRLRLFPAHGVGVVGFGVDAGDFGKRLEQLAFDALFIVVQVLA